MGKGKKMLFWTVVGIISVCDIYIMLTENKKEKSKDTLFFVGNPTYLMQVVKTTKEAKGKSWNLKDN